jgi:hypothetical protein
MQQQSAIGVAAKNPHFNFVTKYFVDKSRQDCCSELREAPARWFGIGESWIASMIQRLNASTT